MKSRWSKRRYRKRHRRKSLQGEVELNMAAMLDMAFQLLAFFILTFRPSPVEAEVLMNMPQAAAVTPGFGSPNELEQLTSDEDFSLPLKVRIHAGPGGDIASVDVGAKQYAYSDTLYDQIDAELKLLFTEYGFNQVEIQSDKSLTYEPLMKVVEKCAKQRLQSGEQLSKLTISTIE